MKQFNALPLPTERWNWKRRETETGYSRSVTKKPVKPEV
jgi:hypothetical protein